MKTQFLILASIICLIACSTEQNNSQTETEFDNISRETKIDTVVMQNIRTGEAVTLIDTINIETEVVDAIVYVRMSNGQNYEFNTLQHTVNVEIEEYKNTRSFTTDLYKPCE
jgi:hypothetical protein